MVAFKLVNDIQATAENKISKAAFLGTLIHKLTLDFKLGATFTRQKQLKLGAFRITFS